MNLSCIFQLVYQSLVKVSTNTGINVVDLCFVRTFINFGIACVTVTLAGKHVVKDVPQELRLVVFLRSIAGVMGFTCLVYAL